MKMLRYLLLVNWNMNLITGVPAMTRRGNRRALRILPHDNTTHIRTKQTVLEKMDQMVLGTSVMIVC
jgi:hypothetical protein